MQRRWLAAAMLLVSALFLIMLASVARATDASPDLRALRSTARVRAAVYFRGLRELDPQARQDAPPDPARQAAAQATWSRIAGIPAELELLHTQAEKLAARRGDAGRDATKSASGDADEPLQSIVADIARIASEAQRLDRRYRPILGEPPPNRARPVATATAPRPSPSPSSTRPATGRAFLTGRVSAGAGSASFHAVNLPGANHQSGTPDFALQGGLQPSANSTLTATISHQRLVEQLAVAHTDAGLAFEQSPNRRLRYRAEAGYRSYSEEDSDLRDYGEARLSAGGEYALAEAARLEARYQLDSRNHPEAAAADFASHRLDSGLRIETGGLRVQGFLSFQKRDCATDGADFTRREPRLVIESAAAGRAPSGVAASLETYDFPGDSLFTSRRLCADAYLGRGEAGRWGVGYVGYERPEAGDSSGAQGYEDLSIYSRQRTASRNALRSGELTLVHRRNRSGPSPDYTGLTLHRRSRVRGSWLPRRELHLAARVYQSQTGRAPAEHFGDLKALLGWDLPLPAGCRLGLDAVAGSRVFIDPHAKGNADPDDDGALGNPLNSGKLGSALRLARTGQKGLQLSGSLKLERNFLYNAQPTRTQTDLDFTIDGRYPVSPAWLFEASASIFRSRTAGVDAATDFDRSNIRIGTTYLFNTGGGSQR